MSFKKINNCLSNDHYSDKCNQQICDNFKINKIKNKCSNFQNKGHNKNYCPLKNCNICLSNDHYSDKCNQQICDNCNKIGHNLIKCPNIICNKCNKLGHTSINCKIEKCINCKELYHIIKKNCPLLNIEKIFCINCKKMITNLLIVKISFVN